jgi:hypothetical protein
MYKIHKNQFGHIIECGSCGCEVPTVESKAYGETTYYCEVCYTTKCSENKYSSVDRLTLAQVANLLLSKLEEVKHEKMA